MIFISSILPKSEKKQTTSKTKGEDTYIVTLEEQLRSIVTSISGAKSTSVFVTLESGTQYLYANETKETREINGENEKQTSEEKYVIVNSGNGAEALLITEISPRVKGVVIVCSGISDQSVKEKIQNAVTTALDLPTMRVCVII